QALSGAAQGQEVPGTFAVLLRHAERQVRVLRGRGRTKGTAVRRERARVRDQQEAVLLRRHGRRVVPRPREEDLDRREAEGYAADPETNAWADPLPLPADAAKAIKNGNYGWHDPVLNAYFLHFASDSTDDGTVWVYRYKKAK